MYCSLHVCLEYIVKSTRVKDNKVGLRQQILISKMLNRVNKDVDVYCIRDFTLKAILQV